MEIYEVRLLFTPEGLVQLCDLRDRARPRLVEWEDLVEKAVALFETTIDETEPDEEGVLAKGELIYSLPGEEYHHFPFPFWLNDKWINVEPEEEDGLIPLTLQILPDVFEQTERIIAKAPHLPSINPVIDCSLWLFAQFDEGDRDGKKFFIYRPELNIINPIPFPFW